jgi:hypothetical protein
MLTMAGESARRWWQLRWWCGDVREKEREGDEGRWRRGEKC